MIPEYRMKREIIERCLRSIKRHYGEDAVPTIARMMVEGRSNSEIATYFRVTPWRIGLLRREFFYLYCFELYDEKQLTVIPGVFRRAAESSPSTTA